MKRRNWKTVAPSSIRQALELTLEYARERRNLSIERIAERMGLANHWVLYKWVSEGRMPAVIIPSFEHVAGINLVTRWLASTSGKLLVDMPTGRTCGAQDMQDLQSVLHQATGGLIAYYAGETEASEVLGAVQAGLESLAWHRGNVQQHAHPQLELGGHGHE